MFVSFFRASNISHVDGSEGQKVQGPNRAAKALATLLVLPLSFPAGAWTGVHILLDYGIVGPWAKETLSLPVTSD